VEYDELDNPDRIGEFFLELVARADACGCVSIRRGHADVLPRFVSQRGDSALPERLRWLSRAAALTFVVISAAGLLRWIGSQEPYWTAVKTIDWSRGGSNVLAAFGELSKIRGVSTLLTELGNFAVILVLIVFSRQFPNDESSVSGLLKFAAKVATIVGGIWLAFLLLRIVWTPYSYSQLRSFDFQFGRTPPPFAEMLMEAIGTFLSQACLFTAPYVVYKSPDLAD
jgi:hypothetical protein